MAAIHINWRRLRQTDVMLAAFAVAAGVGGAWLAGVHLNERARTVEAGLARRFEPARIVVAASDLPQGQVLQRPQLAVREVPRDFVPADAVPAESAGVLLGTRLAVGIARGTPISQAWTSRERQLGLSAVLTDGERALTLSVDDLTSHAGGLREGDRVDLFLARRTEGEPVLIPLLQRVEVLAVGDSIASGSEGMPERFSTITLRVATADAPRVLLAQEAGDISVVLRSRSDVAAEAMPVYRTRELLRSGPQVRPSGIELLTGGHGNAVPEVSWIRIGAVTREAT